MNKMAQHILVELHNIDFFKTG